MKMTDFFFLGNDDDDKKRKGEVSHSPPTTMKRERSKTENTGIHMVQLVMPLLLISQWI